MRKFSPAQAIVIRERLIRYLVDQKRLGQLRADPQGRPIRTGTREILEDIIFSEHTNYEVPPDHDYVDDKPYDYFFDLKDDGLGAFLARRQVKLLDKHLNEILNFLVGDAYIQPEELAEIYAIENRPLPVQPTRPQDDYLERLPNLGEFIAFLTTGATIELRSSLLARVPKTKVIKTLHRDIVFRSAYNENDPAWVEAEVKKGNYRKAFQGSGFCVVPPMGNAYILAFFENGRVQIFEIDVSSSRNEFTEITRGKLRFELLEFAPANIVRAHLSSYSQRKRQFDFRDSDSLGGDGGPTYQRRPDSSNPALVKPTSTLDQSWLTRQLTKGEEAETPEIDWEQQFIEACETLDFPAIIQAFVNLRDILRTSQDSGNTALHWAAVHCSPELYYLTIGKLFMLQPELREFLEKLRLETGSPPKLPEGLMGSTFPLTRNKKGQLPSNLVNSVFLSASDEHSATRLEFFVFILEKEFKASGMSPSEYVDWLISKSDGSEFYPNIIRNF